MRPLHFVGSSGIFAVSAFAQSHVARDVRIEDEQVIAYNRAVAPYVAKARASYPAAKKRFLAGLPAGYTFSVWIRLWQRDAKHNQVHAEDVFVVVDTIKGGKVTGRIANVPEIV